MRTDPVKWAVFTSPFWFLVAGVICTLNVVYKGSPKLGLDKKPAWYIVAVTLGVGFGLAFLAAVFFVPFAHAKVIKKDYNLRVWDIWQGPKLFLRAPPVDAAEARVPNYAVIKHGGEDDDDTGDLVAPKKLAEKQAENEAMDKASSDSDNEIKPAEPAHPAPKTLAEMEDAIAVGNPQAQYRLLLARAEAKHHAKLRQSRGPLGWVSHHRSV